MRKNNIKPEDYKAIDKMYQSGMTMAEIGKIFDVTRQAVSLHMIKAGIQRRGVGRRKKKIEELQM